jgi:hypothetical protein
MTHRGFREGVRGSLILVAWLILGGCSGSSKVPATPKCYLASDCKNPLQCVQGYCVAACVQSRDCPSGERCIGATEGNTCQPLETATCQYTSQCTTPLVCAFDQKCRDQCQKDIDCPTGQKCTSITHLCADPTIDKNYDPATNEFRGAPDAGTGGGSGGVGGAVTGTGGAGGGSGASDAGVDAAVSNPGDDSGAGGGASGSDASVDAPVTNPGDDSGTASGGAGGSAGGAGGSSKRDAGKAGSTGTACQAGQAPSNFGNAATSDSDPHYTSGVGLLTATEFLTFNAYVGPDSTDAGVTESRIDVQHFDPITGKSKGEATSLLTIAGIDKIYITGADIAPTGEIAIIYSAHNIATGGLGDALAFFDKALALSRTTPFVSWGSDYYADSSFVKWINGQFVASSTWYDGNFYIKVGYFAATGANAGGTNAVPTDNPSSWVNRGDNAQGEVAFSGGTFAIGYVNLADSAPYMTLLDAQGDEVGTSVNFSPVFAGAAGGGDRFVSVAGTAQGFVAVYNGTSSAGANSLLTTYVSNSASGDAGVPIGATHAFPGGQAHAGPWDVRGSSDGTGAGFAVHYPNGSVSFLYFGADGSPRGTPQTVLYQQEPAAPFDEVLVTNFGGTFAVSLYSNTEHSTQVIASTNCQ